MESVKSKADVQLILGLCVWRVFYKASCVSSCKLSRSLDTWMGDHSAQRRNLSIFPFGSLFFLIQKPFFPFYMSLHAHTVHSIFLFFAGDYKNLMCLDLIILLIFAFDSLILYAICIQ